MEWREGDYLLTDDPARVDADAVHAALAASYWAQGIPREVFDRSIANALCISVWWEPSSTGDDAEMPRGISAGGGAEAATTQRPQQVAFARVVSDFATVAYLGDVYVLEAHRGRGLSKWMMRAITEHPRLQGLRRWILLTRDAHGLYRQFGFTDLARPDRWMEKWDPEVYR